jgi:penicillin-insensitive murein endopeptidase
VIRPRGDVLSVALLLAWLAPIAPAEASAPTPRGRPSAALDRGPLARMSLSIGAPNAGRQLRAKRLRPSAHLAILDKSRGRTFAHPALVLMLQRSARQIARSYLGSVLVVGDLSLEAGGPLSGHHSHQSGRDADVAFYARDARGRSVKPTHYVAFDADGKAKDGSGLVFDDERNYRLVEAWARDHRAGLAYVFVSRELKARLLAWGRRHGRDRALLERAATLFVQPDHAEPHDDHFHVRIHCPERQEAVCVESARN